MRTEYCGLTDARFLGQTVTLFGWAHRRRDHGGVIFIDMRDREGLVQVVCDPDRKETFAIADRVRNEFVLRVTGVVRRRPEGTVNPDLQERRDRGARPRARDPQPGDHAAVHDGRRDVSEEVRLSYRYLDLRREPMQKALRLRHQAAKAVREYLDDARLHRRRDAGPLQVHARGRARVPRALAHPRRPVLRAAAVAAALQAAADDRGLRPLLPDREVLPRRGPARRPPAGVHADRHRDLLPHRARDPGPHGGPRAPRVQARARRGPARVPAPHLRRGDRRSTAATSPTCA